MQIQNHQTELKLKEIMYSKALNYQKRGEGWKRTVTLKDKRKVRKKGKVMCKECEEFHYRNVMIMSGKGYICATCHGLQH